MLSQHQFYVYHDKNRVLARMENQPPVVAEVFESAQEAHDKVQAIINPDGLHPTDFPFVDEITDEHAEWTPKEVMQECKEMGKDLGFHHPRFQQAISRNCESYVVAAYEAAKKDGA